MTDDLVRRLRLIGEKRLQCTACYKFIDTADEAANRIEKDAQHIDEMYALVAAMNADHTASKTRIETLEAALRDLSDGWECCAVSKNMKLIARKALEGKDD